LPTPIGLLSVRRCIYIPAEPARIWQEFTTFERFSRWFGTGHELVQYEPRLGGTVRLRCQLDGAWREFGGPIVTFEPAAELTFEDQWLEHSSWLQPSLVTLRLTPYLAGTLVELFHHGFEQVGPRFAEEHEGYEGSGWDLHHLVNLKAIVTAA
jgi:uncharacterized protein YndB with AHSA1/START domain